jgi:hypothetical protein
MLFENNTYSQSIRSFTAKDLVESRTFGEISAKLDMIFGPESANAAIDDGEPLTLRYVLSNRYRADIEYSVRVRDYVETGTILKIVFKALRLGRQGFNPKVTVPHVPLIQLDLFDGLAA